MSQYDEDRMWRLINTSFKFRPYNCNAIIAPTGKSRMIDISRQYSTKLSGEKTNDLRQQFLTVFRSLTSPAEYVFALDWESECYVFSPYEDMPADWPVSPLPNGRFVFFITADGRNAYCADGVNMRVYLIGDTLIKQFKMYEPVIFR